jgi:ribonuclease J
LEHYRADKALLVSYTKDSKIAESNLRRVKDGIRKGVPSCELETLSTDVWDLFSCLETYRTIFSEQSGHHVFVNVSTGSKITSIAGMLACMLWGGSPYYAKLNYSIIAAAKKKDTGAAEVPDIDDLPVYSIHKPSQETLSVIRRASELSKFLARGKKGSERFLYKFANQASRRQIHLVKLTFYAGVNEIGGNKILLEDRGTRIFLDFGKSFAARKKYYEWTRRPRIINGIGDLLTLGIVPEINGIYREDLLKPCDRWGPLEQDVYVHGLVLSHAHSDHADYISLLREDIPLWMGEMTRTVIASIEDSKNSDLEFEITEFKRQPRERKDAPIARNITTFRTHSRNEFNVDSISIQPVHVDHSIPGCYGLVIWASDCTIVYSGDLRLHGNRGNLTRDFVLAAAQAKPDLMLCEGTRINESTTNSEADVYRSCKTVVEQTKDSFVFADYSPKDIDRFVTFYKVAKETGRKLLISPKMARYITALARSDPAMNLPSPADVNIGIYKPRESKPTSKDEAYYAQSNVWKAEDIRSKQSAVIASLSSYDADELIDIRPTNGLYIRSMSEPFDEEGEIAEERVRGWMLKFGMQEIQCHSSGHASGLELVEIVNGIAPKTIIPIHTEHAGLFATLFGEANVKLAEPCVSYEFRAS